MLVLTRKIGERIQIGDHVTLMVVKIQGNSVRLGVDAPSDLPIARAELAERGSAAAVLPEQAEAAGRK